ncbi:MAG TPA: hypothetical protein VF071_06845 [Candidatus Limnocylindria bacterium]
MAVTARPRVLLPALVAAVAMGMAGTPATAVEAIPAEDAVALPGSPSYGAIVADVDGDGARELVGLVPWASNPALLAAEVFVMQDGRPASRGQVQLERAAAPDDTFAGNNPDESPLLPLGVNEPARLLAVRIGGEERVLVATMQGATTDPGIGRPCCLTLWWLSVDRTGATALQLIQNTAASGAWTVAADMDADGTDELAVVETPDPVLPAASRIRVLRWNGADFTILTADAGEGLISGPLTVFGDTDGVPGDEVGYTALPGSFDQVAATLHRIALVDGRMQVDWTLLPDAGTVAGFPGPEGGRLFLVARGDAYVLRWPAGTPGASVESISARGGTALGVLGTGNLARLLVVRGGAVEVHDWRLVVRQVIQGGEAAARFVASSSPPYLGELPGGERAGQPALVFGGRLLTAPESPGDDARSRNIAALPGRVPVGFFGEGNGWVAVATAVSLPVDRRGGALTVVAARAGELYVTASRTLLEPEADGGRLSPRIEGALSDGREPGRPALLTSGEVRAVVIGPEDSRVAVVGQQGGPRQASIGPGGRAEVTLVEDDPAATTDERFTVRLLVTTPGGHGYAADWEVRVQRRPPTLAASAPLAPLSFSVPLTGRTAPGARLVVDGTPVPVQPDGSFRAEVGAGLWPRAVRIEATDRIGNASQLTVEIVGLVDYRRLPWIPIVAAMTLLAGALLYLRVPKPKARHVSTDPDEGVLEEIQ